MVKLSNYRHGQVLRAQYVEAPRISRQSAHQAGKVVSLEGRPLLSPRDTPGTYFCNRLCRAHDHSAAGRIKSMKGT